MSPESAHRAEAASIWTWSLLRHSKPDIAQLAEHLTVESVQLSDGPWFDSGCPDFPLAKGMEDCGASDFSADCTPVHATFRFKNPVTRNRTRDHVITARILQSDALPTEL